MGRTATNILGNAIATAVIGRNDDNTPDVPAAPAPTGKDNVPTLLSTPLPRVDPSGAVPTESHCFTMIATTNATLASENRVERINQ